jgi:hypothetical protein
MLPGSIFLNKKRLESGRYPSGGFEVGTYKGTILVSRIISCSYSDVAW